MKMSCVLGKWSPSLSWILDSGSVVTHSCLWPRPYRRLLDWTKPLSQALLFPETSSILCSGHPPLPAQKSLLRGGGPSCHSCPRTIANLLQ